MSLPVLLLAVLPGILITLYVYWRDRHHREPLLLLLLCFLAGAGTTHLAIFLELWGEANGFKESSNPFEMVFYAFVVIATSEELVKFLALMLLAYPWKAFDEPMDGIVYAVTISMGFATLENIFYSKIYGLDITLLRAFTAVPAHAAFAVAMGYFAGLAKYNPKRQVILLVQGLFLAIILHGAYDYFLLQQNIPALTLLAFVILLFGIFFSKRMLRVHEKRSPHRL